MDSTFPDNSGQVHKPDTSGQFKKANRIILGAPPNLYEFLALIEGKMKWASLAKTALLRTVVPEWGGPKAEDGKHVSHAALEFLKTIPCSALATAINAQNNFFKRTNADPRSKRRNRYYLKKLLQEAETRGYVATSNDQSKEPKFNQYCSPAGQHRINARDVSTTNRRRLDVYSLGTSDEHYVVIGGQRFLGNPVLDQQLKDLWAYIASIRKGSPKNLVDRVCGILGFLHDVKGVPLAGLTLESIVPFVQLKFTEKDFEEHPAFLRNSKEQLLDPIAAEQVLATTEAVAQRRAKESAKFTPALLDEFFAWRQEELALKGQPEGLEPSTKRMYLGNCVLIAEMLYEDQTDFKKSKVKSRNRHNPGFDDISAILWLRRKNSDYPIDRKKVKKRIHQTRCIPWLEAMQVFEKLRRWAFNYTIYYRDASRKCGFHKRLRSQPGVAELLQKTLALGLMLFIPTDRQQTYRRLQFGVTLKNGHFSDQDCENFVDFGVPQSPNEAQFWINLEDFKTADTYGEFWYPVPNIQFIDGTTFYELISAWLWGFNDSSGSWPVYHKGQDALWQGYIDKDGHRHGWRQALRPNGHDLIFTMPTGHTAYTDDAFYSMVRNVFVRFTQETGRPVPVAPHSLRHMLSKYLDELKVSDDENDSFSYVLHHSPETHNGNYVYRENMRLIAPAVKRMDQIIHNALFNPYSG